MEASAQRDLGGKSVAPEVSVHAETKTRYVFEHHNFALSIGEQKLREVRQLKTLRERDLALRRRVRAKPKADDCSQVSYEVEASELVRKALSYPLEV